MQKESYGMITEEALICFIKHSIYLYHINEALNPQVLNMLARIEECLGRRVADDCTMLIAANSAKVKSRKKQHQAYRRIPHLDASMLDQTHVTFNKYSKMPLIERINRIHLILAFRPGMHLNEAVCDGKITLFMFLNKSPYLMTVLAGIVSDYYLFSMLGGPGSDYTAELFTAVAKLGRLDTLSVPLPFLVLCAMQKNWCALECMVRHTPPAILSRHINAVTPQGNTVLSACIELEHYDITRLLLEHGADPNQPIPSPALFKAISLYKGKTMLKIIQALFAKGASLDMPLSSGNLMGYTFAISSHSLIKQLLRFKPKLNALAADELCRRGDVPLCEMVYRYDSTIFKLVDCIELTAKRGHFALWRYFLGHLHQAQLREQEQYSLYFTIIALIGNFNVDIRIDVVNELCKLIWSVPMIDDAHSVIIAFAAHSLRIEDEAIVLTDGQTHLLEKIQAGRAEFIGDDTMEYVQSLLNMDVYFQHLAKLMTLVSTSIIKHLPKDHVKEWRREGFHFVGQIQSPLPVDYLTGFQYAQTHCTRSHITISVTMPAQFCSEIEQYQHHVEPMLRPSDSDALEDKPMSGFAYLSKRFGLLAAKATRNNRRVDADQPVSESIDEVPEETIEWFSGNLLATNQSLSRLENTQHYLYVDELLMLKQKCPGAQLQKFRDVRAMNKGNNCVKQLKGSGFSTTMTVSGQSVPVQLSHEIKITDCADRIVLGSVPSRCQRHLLFVSVFYVRGGFHDQSSAAKKSVLQRCENGVELSLPRDFSDMLSM